MDQFLIRGARSLSGTVQVSGAKNAALPALAASILTHETVGLGRVPRVRDVATMLRVLEHLGAECEAPRGERVRTRFSRLLDPEAPYGFVKTMRASILVLGPLLARFGRARISLPGGCAIGARPIDSHLSGLEKMGAVIELSHGYVDARADSLHGADIAFARETVTGTENLLMAATLARGRTTLRNCALEPEVADLAGLLASMGARIQGAGSPTIVVEGVDHLHGAEHDVIPDRIEAGTFVMAAALAGDEIVVEGCEPRHMAAPLEVLSGAGLRIETGQDWIRVIGRRVLSARDVETAPYPGFPTDLQAQYMAVMTQAQGESVISETIFENRMMHVGELRRMGAVIAHDGNHARVRGPVQLSGAQVMATDLRASACLVLAALVADGVSVIDRVYHIDRGYERIEEKLRALGADVERVSK